MKLTREQFIAQFPCEVHFEGITPVPYGTFEGVEVFRALQLIVIRIDGKFYGTGKN